MTTPGGGYPAQDGFTVETDHLYASVKDWVDRSATMAAGAKIAVEGQDLKSAFGLLAELSSIGERHDTFIASMVAALLEGALSMGEIGFGLNTIATAYDAADRAAAGAVQGAGG